MRIVSAAIAISIGLLVLAGYFIPALGGIQAELLNWAILLAGVAALMAFSTSWQFTARRSARARRGAFTARSC
jgi:hypothetical protein